MSSEQEYRYYATSYALKAKELYYRFPYKKYINVDNIPEKQAQSLLFFFGSVLRYFFKLVIEDIIENKVTFKFPPGTRAWLEMRTVSGNDFIKVRLAGGFEDVDYLASNFTGHNIILRYNSRYGHWHKLIYVSKPHKNRITELTNLGEKW